MDYSDTAVPAKIRERHERALTDLKNMEKSYEAKHGGQVEAPEGSLVQAINDLDALWQEIYL